MKSAGDHDSFRPFTASTSSIMPAVKKIRNAHSLGSHPMSRRSDRQNNYYRITTMCESTNLSPPLPLLSTSHRHHQYDLLEKKNSHDCSGVVSTSSSTTVMTIEGDEDPNSTSREWSAMLASVDLINTKLTAMESETRRRLQGDFQLPSSSATLPLAIDGQIEGTEEELLTKTVPTIQVSSRFSHIEDLETVNNTKYVSSVQQEVVIHDHIICTFNCCGIRKESFLSDTYVNNALLFHRCACNIAKLQVNFYFSGKRKSLSKAKLLVLKIPPFTYPIPFMFYQKSIYECKVNTLLVAQQVENDITTSSSEFVIDAIVSGKYLLVLNEPLVNDNDNTTCDAACPRVSLSMMGEYQQFQKILQSCTTQISVVTFAHMLLTDDNILDEPVPLFDNLADGKPFLRKLFTFIPGDVEVAFFQEIFNTSGILRDPQSEVIINELIDMKIEFELSTKNDFGCLNYFSRLFSFRGQMAIRYMEFLSRCHFNRFVF